MAVVAEDFNAELQKTFADATSRGLAFVEVNAGDLHRAVGGYPSRTHRMPSCYDVMKRHLSARDQIISEPPSGRGASMTIRYALPR